MKNKFKFLATAFIITSLSFGQNTQHKLDSILKSKHQEYPEVGISIGLLQGEKEFYSALGKINKESTLAIDKHSIFEIASITKAITANLIAVAINENKIDVNGYIDDYLPKEISLHENIKNTIKVSDLASHQSGLPDIDFRELIALNPQQPVKSVTKKIISTMMANCTELEDHGNYRYSTIGFILLGQILENSYGKSYAEIVQEKMLDPLHMTHTLTKDFNVENRTTGYNPEGGAQEFFEWNITAAAGLIKSDAHDMVTYLKALLNEESTMAKAAVLTQETFYKNTAIEIGLGVNVIRDGDSIIYAKTGDTMGQSSIMAYNTTKKWGVIVLINQRNPKVRSGLFNEIYEVLLK